MIPYFIILVFYVVFTIGFETAYEFRFPSRTCSRTWTWTWTELDAASLNLGLCVARPRWPHWSCVTVSRGLNWFLKLNLAPLTREGRQTGGRSGGEVWCCCNLNGCGNWEEGLLNVLCASPLDSCCVLYLFVASFNLVFLIWNFT